MDTNINSRINQLRDELHLSRQAFGKALGVSDSVIKNIDYNKTEPKTLLIDQICKVYNVNKNWLLTGDGEMFRRLSEDEELAQLFGEALSGSMDPRKRRAIKAIMEMIRDIPDEFLPTVREYARRLADTLEETKEDGDD